MSSPRLPPSSLGMEPQHTRCQSSHTGQSTWSTRSFSLQSLASSGPSVAPVIHRIRRAGRRFFNDHVLEREFLDRVRLAAEKSGLWDELRTAWLSRLRTDAVVCEGAGAFDFAVCTGCRRGHSSTEHCEVGIGSGQITNRRFGGACEANRNALGVVEKASGKQTESDSFGPSKAKRFLIVRTSLFERGGDEILAGILRIGTGLRDVSRTIQFEEA